MVAGDGSFVFFGLSTWRATGAVADDTTLAAAFSSGGAAGAANTGASGASARPATLPGEVKFDCDGGET
ncbi:MAG TPA: hypothetical protein VII70_06705, partial [Steroidobacteraceae bacterium]